MLTLCKRLSKHCPSYTNPLFRDDVWKDYEDKVERYVYKKILKENQLQSRIVLYHGTCNPNFSISELQSDRITFFGIEPVICMWYTLEEAEKNDIQEKYGYVYEFIIVNPISIDRYIPSIKQHPERESCVHPQVTLHGYNNYNALKGPFDLSVEVTLHNKDLQQLRFVKRYCIELDHLRRHSKYSINQLELIEDDEQLLFKGKPI